jgi:histidinol-phosphatase (PHP family)
MEKKEHFMKWDGHTHTPYCPHGSRDSLNAYIEEAIRQGFERYSITEHAPLPYPFIDPVPAQDSAMHMADLENYLEECHRLKVEYRSKIDIRVGLEVDYLLGFEEETKLFLDHVGPRLDDAILSVHFLPVANTWVCLDYSADTFEQNLLPHFSGIDHLYLHYYGVMLQAVNSELGKYKPRRIGHLSLIEKFKKKFPYLHQEIWWDQALQVLRAIKKQRYQLDFNTAGLQKELCKDIYPSAEIYKKAIQLGIPFVYGSDAHQAKDVGQHFNHFS